jgi:hypothetical protein
MPCIVCKHNQTRDIDRAFLTSATLTALNRKYGTTSDLHRHQKLLRQKMAQAHREFHDGLCQGLFCKLNLVMEMVLGVVRGALAGRTQEPAPKPAPENWQLTTDPGPKNQRETSAKLARN